MTPKPRRGEIWRVDLDPTRGHEQSGQRPFLVVSDDLFNAGAAQMCIGLPLTSRDKRIPSHVPVAPPEGGLSVASWIKCEDVRAVSTLRLGNRIGAVSGETMEAVEFRLRILLKL